MNGFPEIIAQVLNDPNKIRHIFHPKHNLDKLGTPKEVLEKVTKAIFEDNNGGTLPQAGSFKITRQVDGYPVEIRGAIINGKLRYGTIFRIDT